MFSLLSGCFEFLLRKEQLKVGAPILHTVCINSCVWHMSALLALLLLLKLAVL